MKQLRYSIVEVPLSTSRAFLVGLVPRCVIAPADVRISRHGTLSKVSWLCRVNEKFQYLAEQMVLP
jgi:hypothetical protein